MGYLKRKKSERMRFRGGDFTRVVRKTKEHSDLEGSSLREPLRDGPTYADGGQLHSGVSAALDSAILYLTRA